MVVCDGMVLSELEPASGCASHARRSRRRCCTPRPRLLPDPALEAALGRGSATPTADRLTRAMLAHLQIRDFAIVEAVEVEFGSDSPC